MKNLSKLLLIYISSLFLFGWIWGWAEYSPPEPQPTGDIVAPAPKHINSYSEELEIENNENNTSNDELDIITKISQRITQDYGAYYLGCSYSSNKYVIFRLSMDLNFFYDNYQSIEQELNKISKYGHSHLPSEKTCIILIEKGEKCLFLSENGRGYNY